MTQPPKIAKAELHEITLGYSKKDTKEINSDKAVKVQFNPQTLKLNYSNQIKSDNQKGGSGIQFVGKGTTKLSLDLWFDITVPLPEGTGNNDPKKKVRDVRILTEKVKYFITPGDQKGTAGKMPAVRFIWGSFIFDGVMESMNETLEFFSDDGRPLRANISISIASQEIFRFEDLDKNSSINNTPGTKPLVQAQDGDSVSKLAAREGQNRDWKSVAAANNIEDPLRLKPGTYVNL